MSRWALACIAAIVVAPVGFGDSASAQSQLERGGYLVNGILTCGNCHTPRGPGGVFDMAKQLAGGPQTWDTPQYKVKGSNITPDKETGIGNWTERADQARDPGRRAAQRHAAVAADAVRLLQDLHAGRHRRGGRLRQIGARDPQRGRAAGLQGADARRHSARRREAVQPRPTWPTRSSAASISSPSGTAWSATPRPPAGTDFKNSLGKGGEEFKGPWGVSVARNITSHKEKGIGGWTDAEIKAAITQGKRRDGTPLKPPMGYPLYATMTDADLTAIVAYLRTVPPKE